MATQFRRRVLILILVLLCGPWAAARAGAAEKPRVPFSKAQILKMGSERFCGWWAKQNRGTMNGSEQGLDSCAIYYAAVRREANRVQLRRLPLKDRVRLMKAYNALAGWETNVVSMESVYEGGGTMYEHRAARQGARNEDLLAKCLRDYRAPAPPGNATNTLFANSLVRLRRLRPKHETSDKDYALYKQQRLKALADLATLAASVSWLPPLSQKDIAEYVWRIAQEVP